MTRLQPFTVFVAMAVVDARTAIPVSRIVEVRDVQAPSRDAAVNVGTAWAIDQLGASVSQARVNKVWVEEPARR